MNCFKCGAPLGKGVRCNQCGADVSLYKKSVMTSIAYYNLGLSKARVRDLSGAVESLKMSVAIDRHNILARNLLGLVYCEMGNVIEALSEWVVSKNLSPDNNPAGAYIKKIQSNQSRFEQITVAIKKYNISLKYAKEGNYDMAQIQLKKIVGQYPKLLQAQLLLALLYMKDGEWNKARKPLVAVLKVDKNNTLAHLYMQQIETELQIKKGSSFLTKSSRKQTPDKALNGHDVIIPKSSYREPSNGAVTVINVLIGAVVGAALIWFLITPARYKGINADYNNTIKEYSEQMSDDSAKINTLTSELQRVKDEKEELEKQLGVIGGENGSNKLLTDVIEAANMYIADNTTGAAEKIIAIDVTQLPTDAAKSLYNTISNATRVSAATDLYNKGLKAYNSQKYPDASEYFKKAYQCDSTRAEIAYYAAKSYQAQNNTAEAKKYYQYIVDEFKSSSYFVEADAFVKAN